MDIYRHFVKVNVDLQNICIVQNISMSARDHEPEQNFPMQVSDAHLLS